MSSKHWWISFAFFTFLASPILKAEDLESIWQLVLKCAAHDQHACRKLKSTSRLIKGLLIELLGCSNDRGVKMDDDSLEKNFLSKLKPFIETGEIVVENDAKKYFSNGYR